MAKGDVLVRMKADTTGYNANIAKARRTLDSFKQDNLTLGGILNQSTKSIVAAAAQYASFAAVIGTVVSGMQNAISEGTRMAREMEGVKMAFDRLNQPGLLDNLREATHGTVNDLELMKNAVKFENFGLSLEQMGTFLAFAQQQAKDTGQSVEYLVDSIVTGLGRKSLPILDNLGLSATEIKERMKETGDMTKAVADIIKDRMEKSGGYVETAADRAAQAQVRLDNAMTDLGKTFQSLTGEASSLWTELEIGAINLLNTAIKPLIAAFNALASYANVPTAEDIVTKGMTDVTDTVDDNGRLIRKNAITSIPEVTIVGTKPTTNRKGGSGTKTEKTEEQLINENIQKLTQEYIKASNDRQAAIRDEIKGLQDQLAVIKQLKDEALGKTTMPIVGMRGLAESPVGISTENPFEKYKDASFELVTPLQQLEKELLTIKDLQAKAWSPEVFAAYQKRVEEVQGKIDTFKGIKKDADTSAKSFNDAAQSIASVGSALQSLEDPGAKIAGIIGEAVAQIALGFAQATAAASGGGPLAWFAAITGGLATMVSTIQAIHSATGYAHGGIVDGNSYSGDNIPIMANAGEVVLTRSMTNNLASQLQGVGLQNLHLSATVSGTQLRFVLNNESQSRGRGMYVTTNFNG